MTKLIQANLSAGEVSPAVAARVDIDKRKAALATCLNYFVRAQGGVQNRAGFSFVAEVKDSTAIQRLRPFEFNTSQTYAIEFGDLYARFHTNGGLVLDSNNVETITAATQADPVVITTSGAHGWSNGQEIFIASVAGMTELNGRSFLVANVTGTTAELQDKGGTDVDGSAYTAYTSGGQAFLPYEVVTPYLEAELFELSFVQSADVMTITHPNHDARNLSRLANDSWTLEEIVFVPEQAKPTGVQVSVGTTGSVTDRYVVTAINRESGEESLRGLNNAQETISGITQANPGVVTVTGHPYVNGDEIFIAGVVGMTEVNDRVFRVANVTTNTFELTSTTDADVDTTGFTAYTSGGTSNRMFVEITNGASTRNNTVSWTAADGAESYAVYREDNGLYGFIGNSELTSFTDDNIEPDVSDTPPKFRNPFVGSEDRPSTSGYFQQRQVYANTDRRTQTLFLSQTANFYNMSVSSPARNDDAITVTLASTKANEIKHLVPLQDLIVLTSGAEWVITGIDGQLTPSGIRAEPQTYYGSTDLPPIVAGDTVIYMQPGEIVRDLGYKFETDAYAGNDVSILARHLFDYNTVVDWTFAVSPFGVIWCVRDDGIMLGLTYLREQNVFAWHRHTTRGKFKSVCAIREDNDDRVYAIIERQVGGRTVKFVERMDDRKFKCAEDAMFLDASVTVDTPITITGFTNADPVVVTAPAHGLSNGDIVDLSDINVVDADNTQGFRLDITEINGTGYTVANVTTNTFELQNAGSDVDGTAFAVYHSGGYVRLATDTIENLWHLEGETLVCLNNGYVERGLVVTNGQVTLTDPGSRKHIGYPYVSEIENLSLDAGAASAETIQSKSKKTARLSVVVEDTLGMWHAPAKSRDFREANFAAPALWGQPPSLYTGVVNLTLKPDWNKDGTFVLQQRDPLPSTILALIPDVYVGGN